MGLRLEALYDISRRGTPVSKTPILTHNITFHSIISLTFLKDMPLKQVSIVIFNVSLHQNPWPLAKCAMISKNTTQKDFSTYRFWIKQLCFSFYNANILQLNVAMWGSTCFGALVQCTSDSYAPVAYLTCFN